MFNQAIKTNFITDKIKNNFIPIKTVKELQRIIYNTEFSRKTIRQSAGKTDFNKGRGYTFG